MAIMVIILLISNKWYMSNKNKNKSTFRRWGYTSDSCKFGNNSNNINLHGLKGKSKVIGSNYNIMYRLNMCNGGDSYNTLKQLLPHEETFQQ